MMVEMILLDNNDKSVTYEVRNHDKNIKIDNITVNKHDKSYVLESGKKIDNQFVSSTYRVILKCLEDGKYPKSYANGWGQIRRINNFKTTIASRLFLCPFSELQGQKNNRVASQGFN